MILAGINHGDLLVVHRGLKAENGDIVVARVGEDSATVKRIFFEQDAIRLQPENRTWSLSTQDTKMWPSLARSSPYCGGIKGASPLPLQGHPQQT